MEYDNRWWILVAYLSKSLNETERNYEIHNKEMLAVIKGLDNWKYLLEDAKFKFEIYMDHKLKHVLVIKIKKTDGLSRRPDWKVATKNNN